MKVDKNNKMYLALLVVGLAMGYIITRNTQEISLLMSIPAGLVLAGLIGLMVELIKGN